MSTKRYDVAENKSTHIGESRLLYISSAKYGGDWESTPHSHQCTELFYVVGGAGGFQIESETFQVKAHDLVIINSNIQHTETSLNSAPLEYIVLGVEGLELIRPSDHGGRYFILNLKSLSDSVLPIMRIMLSEVEQQKPGADSVCQNLLQALLIQLIRITQASPESTVRATRKECATAKWYIDAHYKEKITLDVLAKVCGVNKYYLAHSFTEEYGIAPIQYLKNKRIEESKYLLSTTDYPIGVIVQTLGFSSASYFARMFQTAVGVNPSEFRAQGTHAR